MNKKTILRIMTFLTVIIAIVALGVGIYAIILKQWLIAGVMLMVMIGQAINFTAWRKKLR